MIIITKEKKIYWWNKILKDYKKMPKLTLKRLEKLKKIIWNDYTNFWFFIERQPQDMFEIILQRMYIEKIIN